MEYSKLFSTDAEHIEYINSADYKEPYVSYIEADGHAHYNYNIGLYYNFLRFTAVSNTASICINSQREHISTPVSIKYSKTGTIDSWQNMSTTPVSLSKGETIYLMGLNTSGLYDLSLTTIFNDTGVENGVITGEPFFNMTGQLMGGGNIMSIVNTSEDNNFQVADEIPASENDNDFYGYFISFFIGNDSLLKAPELNVEVIPNYACIAMYANCTLLLIVPEYNFTSIGFSGCAAMFFNCTKLLNFLSLPATTLSTGAYAHMFGLCTSLKNIPNILPATTLPAYENVYGVYYSMFKDCTSLTTAPALPAETLLELCYCLMFEGCTSLTSAPALPATTLAPNCYDEMFRGCTSLTTAPALPATTLTNNCYYSMFYDCTSLTTPPSILPATTLVLNCYSSMFYGCTSLTTAPELPATTLANNCYYRMFYGCTSLTATPVLAVTDIAASAAFDGCYAQMFMNCKNLNTVTCLSTKNYRIYLESSGSGPTPIVSGWRRTIHTEKWLDGVSETGTIYMSDNVGFWANGDAYNSRWEDMVTPKETTRGSSSIPIGWTVETYQA